MLNKKGLSATLTPAQYLSPSCRTPQSTTPSKANVTRRIDKNDGGWPFCTENNQKDKAVDKNKKKHPRNMSEKISKNSSVLWEGEGGAYVGLGDGRRKKQQKADKKDKQHQIKKALKQDKEVEPRLKKARNTKEKPATKTTRRQNNLVSQFRSSSNNLKSQAQSWSSSLFKKSHQNSRSELCKVQSIEASPACIKPIPDLKQKLKKASNKKTQRLNGHLANIPSHTEYCIVGGEFIPIQSNTDRKCIEQILGETACSEFTSDKKSTLKPQESYEKSLSISQINKKEEKTERAKVSDSRLFEQIGIQTIKAEMNSFSVLVKAAHEEIGVQYSDRLNTNSNRKAAEKDKQITALKNQRPQIDQIHIGNQSKAAEPNPKKSQVLLEAMMNLQALQVGEGALLDHLNPEQKRHFRNILSTMMLKMASPRVQRSINCFRNVESDEDSIKQIEFLKTSQAAQNQNGEMAILPTKDNFEQVDVQFLDACDTLSIQMMKLKQQNQRQQLQQRLIVREMRQKNEYGSAVLRSPEQIETCIQAVLSIYQNICCYTQMNYEQEAINSLNRLYGLSYHEKYKEVSKYYRTQANRGMEKATPIGVQVKKTILDKEGTFPILPRSLFEKFMIEVQQDSNQDEEEADSSAANEDETRQSYFKIHCKAVFDCASELMTAYRPFYQTMGDPLPWNLVPLKCLTYYSIESDSFETMTEQIEEKLSKNLDFLCGLHVDCSFYSPGSYLEKQNSKDWQKDVVFAKRRERLSREIFMTEFEGDRNDEYLELEIGNTAVMYELSLLIEKKILDELTSQLFLLRHKQDSNSGFTDADSQ